MSVHVTEHELDIAVTDTEVGVALRGGGGLLLLSLGYDGDCTRSPDLAYVSYLDVHRQFRRRGVARALLGRACEIADDGGLTLHLLAAPGDEDVSLRQLIAFYESEGFVILNDQDVTMIRRPVDRRTCPEGGRQQDTHQPGRSPEEPPSHPCQ